MNLGAYCLLLAGSSSHAVGKRCTAQQRPLTDAMTLYLVLTACAASGLLVCVQEVVPTPIPPSARRSSCPSERLHHDDHPDAREPRRSDELALPQASLLG